MARGHFWIEETGNLNSDSELEQCYFEQEDHFQEFLFSKPQIIESLTPLRESVCFVPIMKEMHGCDIVGIDQNGVIYLIEVKRHEDSRCKRRVVTQVLDYGREVAANYSSSDQFLQAAFPSSINIKTTLVETFADRLSNFTSESAKQLIDNMENNRLSNRFRYMIISDGVPETLVEFVEFVLGHAHPNYQLIVGETAFFGHVADNAILSDKLANMRIVTRIKWQNIVHFPTVQVGQERQLFDNDEDRFLAYLSDYCNSEEVEKTKWLVASLKGIEGLSMTFGTGKCPVAIFKPIGDVRTSLFSVEVSGNAELHFWFREEMINSDSNLVALKIALQNAVSAAKNFNRVHYQIDKLNQGSLVTFVDELRWYLSGRVRAI